MKIRIRSVFTATIIIAVVLFVMIVISATLLNKKKSNDEYHLEAHITQLVILTTQPYLERRDLVGLQRIVDNITTQPGILYLTIEKEGEVWAHAHSSQDPAIKITTINVPIKNSLVPNLNAVIGFQAQHFESVSTSFGRIVIIATIVLALTAILGCYFMLMSAIRPLKRLHQLQEEPFSISNNSELDYTDDIHATVDMILATRTKLEKSYQQLHFSLKEQKYSYSEARQIEEQNEAIYKASNDAIIVANDQDIIIEFSPVAEQIFGWERDAIVGKSMASTIVPPRMRDKHLQGMRHFLQTGEGAVLDKRIELTAIRRSGREFPIEISISAAKTEKGYIFVSYIRDITQRLQNQTELKIAAHAFETSQPVFIADNQGHIIRCNPAFTSVTGYQSHDVEGKKTRNLRANADDSGFHKHIWRVLNSEGRWDGEIRLKHKKGHEIPVHMSVTSVKDENDDLTHYVAHFFDLTERKRGEEKLRELRNAAENANRAKSRFLAAMSHEIRTPMNGVLGVLGLLKETALTELQLKLVRTARESGELLLAIINDILDFSKMEAGKLILENAPFNMHALLEQTVDIVYPQAEKKNLQLMSRILEDTPKFLIGDSDRIRQILLNLLSNAVKYTDSGSVTITLSCLHWHPDSVKLQVDVTDTGIGIDAKYIPNLFDEFTMAEASYNRRHEGSGLGLAICKQLVNQMNGEISVVSGVNKGSTFTFTIELGIADEQELEATPENEEAAPDNIARDLRILMAEDNPANQVVLRTMLEFSGLSVDIVSNGKEAIEAVSRHPYDIVLMDISMPGMDGMEATRIIREMDSPAKDMIIVALTAHALRGDKENFIAQGMNDFISKPFTRKSIIDCLAKWQPRKGNSTLGSSDNKGNTGVSPATQPAASHQPVTQREPDNTVGALVDEMVLSQLVKDTSADTVPELIHVYLKDARERIGTIASAAEKRDFYTLEFETHTLGSSAAAHSNMHLYHVCQSIEKHCQEQAFDKALDSVKQLNEIASLSFRALRARTEQGFSLR